MEELGQDSISLATLENLQAPQLRTKKFLKRSIL